MKLNGMTAFAVGVALSGSLAAGGLEIKDTEGQHLDVMSDGRVLVRYMYAHDTSSKERHHETYKPYLHVFDAEGSEPITKGPGGQYTHHRGIFLGWSRLQFDGRSYDRWHMKGGDIVHQEFLREEAKGDTALFTSRTHWNGNEGKPLLDEERTTEVRLVPDGPAAMQIDVTFKLTASYGDVHLKGDPEHAGIQYRPAEGVKNAKYTFPTENVNLKNDHDLPWIAETYEHDGKTYSVVQMNHPGNPKGTRHSAYRDYGRFGSFFEKEIKKGESVTVDYRYLIFYGELPEREVIQEGWKEYAKNA